MCNDWKNLKNKHFTRRKNTFETIKPRSIDTKRVEIISHEAGGRLVKRLKRDGGSASIYLALGREDGEFIGLSIANLSASVCYHVFELPQTKQTRSVYIFPERPTHTQHRISSAPARAYRRRPLFARVRSLTLSLSPRRLHVRNLYLPPSRPAVLLTKTRPREIHIHNAAYGPINLIARTDRARARTRALEILPVNCNRRK